MPDDDARSVNVSVRDLLSGDLRAVLPAGRRRLVVPDYQRPYTWTEQNVGELIDDIRAFALDHDEYRIGTVILCDDRVSGNGDVPDNGSADSTADDDPPAAPGIDIVDGQQRIVTFILLLAAMSELDGRNPVGAGAKAAEETARYGDNLVLRNGSRTGRRNILDNHRTAVRLLGRFDADERSRMRKALLDKCTVTVIVVHRLDEAFQLFDSQNARGKALDPTDLLKAFHIREMERDGVSPGEEMQVVRDWESIPAEDMQRMFADCLYRIRKWSAGESVDEHGFTANEIDMFKGIRLSEDHAGDNWAKVFLYAKSLVDEDALLRGALARSGVAERLAFPYQINQPMINGRSFFEFARHYYDLCRRLRILGVSAKDDEGDGEQNGDRSLSRDSLIHEFERIVQRCGGRHGRLKWAKTLFDCLLLAYADRFGTADLDAPLDSIARYASLMRMNRGSVSFDSVNRYVLADDLWRDGEMRLKNPFRTLTTTYSADGFPGFAIADASESNIADRARNAKSNKDSSLKPFCDWYRQRYLAPRPEREPGPSPERSEQAERLDAQDADAGQSTRRLIIKFAQLGVPAAGIYETLKSMGIVTQSASGAWWRADGLDGHGQGNLIDEIAGIIDEENMNGEAKQ
ncbi:DUF262 domain-containing protein [Bifidobacterium biavatii]|uniref:DUF262 domain-containing protein n=1 Tax=Bifidobacterium biavatii TaxID=762212 RepID=UPI000A9F309A|nr:DUF262 domain-containing protein [Bifidobacterium biavatii]